MSFLTKTTPLSIAFATNPVMRFIPVDQNGVLVAPYDVQFLHSMGAAWLASLKEKATNETWKCGGIYPLSSPIDNGIYYNAMVVAGHDGIVQKRGMELVLKTISRRLLKNKLAEGYRIELPLLVAGRKCPTSALLSNDEIKKLLAHKADQIIYINLFAVQQQAATRCAASVAPKPTVVATPKPAAAVMPTVAQAPAIKIATGSNLPQLPTKKAVVKTVNAEIARLYELWNAYTSDTLNVVPFTYSPISIDEDKFTEIYQQVIYDAIEAHPQLTEDQAQVYAEHDMTLFTRAIEQFKTFLYENSMTNEEAKAEEEIGDGNNNDGLDQVNVSLAF